MGGERLLARKRGEEGIEIFVERWGTCLGEPVERVLKDERWHLVATRKKEMTQEKEAITATMTMERKVIGMTTMMNWQQDHCAYNLNGTMSMSSKTKGVAS